MLGHHLSHKQAIQIQDFIVKLRGVLVLDHVWTPRAYTVWAPVPGNSAECQEAWLFHKILHAISPLAAPLGAIPSERSLITSLHSGFIKRLGWEQEAWLPPKANLTLRIPVQSCRLARQNSCHKGTVIHTGRQKCSQKYSLTKEAFTPLTSSKGPRCLFKSLDGVLILSKGVLGRGIWVDIVNDGAGKPGMKTFPTW